MTYNLVYHCKAQLDWGTWSSWLAYFKANTASNANPNQLTAAQQNSVDLTSYMVAAESKFDIPETKANWFHDFVVNMDPHGRLIEDSVESESPVVGVVYAYIQPINGWRLASQLMVLVEEAFKTVFFFSSNYYYYNLSYSFFKLCTTFFVMVDHVAKLNMIVPTPSWNRYRTNQ